MQGEADATLRSVLRHLIDYGPMSRPALGDGVDLARATTSKLVNDLMRRDLVGEIRTTSNGRRGRPSSLLDVDDDHYAVIGVEIGLDRILAACYSLRGRELRRVEQPVEAQAADSRALLRWASSTLHEVTTHTEQVGRRLLGVGVSVPGLVDASSGTVKYAPSLGWRDVALSAGVDQAFADVQHVSIGKDADFAALAERRARLRQGQVADSLLYLTGTYGISGGLVGGDRVWTGARGLAGEVGHIIVDPAGTRCECGRTGCFETKAGLAAIVRSALQHTRRNLRHANLAAAVDEVVSRAAQGDEQVLAAIAEAGRWLGEGAAVLAAILDPRVVILGGHYARLAPWLLGPARQALAASAVVPAAHAPGIELSIRGAWAAAEGAALSVLLGLTDAPNALPNPGNE